MIILVEATRISDQSVLFAEVGDYTSDEALGEVCGGLVARVRKSGHSAQDVSLNVKFLEEFPSPICGFLE